MCRLKTIWRRGCLLERTPTSAPQGGGFTSGSCVTMVLGFGPDVGFWFWTGSLLLVWSLWGFCTVPFVFVSSLCDPWIWCWVSGDSLGRLVVQGHLSEV